MERKIINGCDNSGRHSKQRYGKTLLFYSDHIRTWLSIRYGDGAGNAIEENSSVFSLIRMR